MDREREILRHLMGLPGGDAQAEYVRRTICERLLRERMMLELEELILEVERER